MFRFILLLVLVQGVLGNEYDPHIYPAVGPFFEGWYSRLTDHEHSRSLGILFGTVLPETQSKNATLSYLAVFRSNGSRYSLVAEETAPKLQDISITVRNGSTPTSDPDIPSPPNFQWVCKPNGFFNVTERSTIFDITVGEVRLSGNFSRPLLWDPDSFGPEGWLTVLPLPIHWFVYSLGTPGSYRWVNLTNGDTVEGSGYLHQEKNWGEAFPSGWIWTEGLQIDDERNISYAGTFGTLDVGPFAVPAFLFGYRNNKKGISLDFRVSNSLSLQQLEPCDGIAIVTVMSLRYTLTLEMTSNETNFQSCLCGPKRNGFVPVVTESFVTVTKIRVIHHVTMWDVLWRTGEVIDEVTLEGAALEFGGEYMCEDNSCKSKTSCDSTG